MPRAAFFALGEQASRLRVADGVGNYFCYPWPQAKKPAFLAARRYPSYRWRRLESLLSRAAQCFRWLRADISAMPFVLIKIFRSSVFASPRNHGDIKNVI